MRYRPEHKVEIHQKIVKDASRRMRTEGLTGASVSTVMRDTGLTHGSFYKHFESKDEMLMESLGAAFQEIADRLTQAAEHPQAGMAWKAVVKAYLSPEHCDHVECGCPLAALASELARADKAMKVEIFETLTKYRNRMLPFMPGRRVADRERAFFAIFSTMIGAIAIARILPGQAERECVLGNARDFLLHSF
jgi:TetR/AcrR family transcriptional repressor of nem operon